MILHFFLMCIKISLFLWVCRYSILLWCLLFFLNKRFFAFIDFTILLVIQGLDLDVLLDNFTKEVCVLITSIKVSKNNVNLKSAHNEMLERLCLSLSSRSGVLNLFPVKYPRVIKQSTRTPG